jgi:hypothetical protein
MLIWSGRRDDRHPHSTPVPWERFYANRARKIADPVERLRYLRRAANQSAFDPRRVYAIAILSLGFLLPAHTLPQQSFLLRPALTTTTADTAVWLVQKGPAAESYSNGLRIETASTVTHHPRTYLLFTEDDVERAESPAGIVFHSTESEVAPFAPQQAPQMRRLGQALLDYVRAHRCYHYVIDRFGRVYRMVDEASSADHAGNSAWSWNGRLCLNLNHAFLGVAFEGRTDEPLSAAQLHSGKVIVEMLRARYRIPAENCVTHAQVSVNPDNLRVGWHTDWARNFPFAGLGLPDNYRHPVTAVAELGFGFDPAYLDAAGEGLWIGLHRAEILQRSQPVSRRQLQLRYESLRRKETS